MSNIQNTENKYVAQLHWIIFCWPCLLVLAGLFLRQNYWHQQHVGLLLIGVGVALVIINFMIYLSSSITIDNRSVIFRSGILVRNTTDIPFNKVESIDIRQNILGSLLDYGTIVIVGTGGTRNVMNYVEQPLTCRRLIEQVLQR